MYYVVGYDNNVTGDKMVCFILYKVAAASLGNIVNFIVVVRVIAHSFAFVMLNIDVLMKEKFMSKLVSIEFPFHVDFPAF